MIYAVLVVILSAVVVRGFEDDAVDALEFERDNFRPSESIESTSDRGLISKMIERGKHFLKSIPGTIKVTADRVFNLVPKPETIFRVSKQALIGLPQEAIAYAVNSMCKYFILVLKCINVFVHVYLRIYLANGITQQFTIRRQCSHPFECYQTNGNAKRSFDEFSFSHTER